MKKKLLALFMVVAVVVGIFAFTASAASMKNKVNTFDIYRSSDYVRQTRGTKNSDVRMIAGNDDGSAGRIYIDRGYVSYKKYEFFPYSNYGSEMTYQIIGGVKDGSRIRFLRGNEIIAEGTIHIRNGSGFWYIWKIDAFGTGLYFKWV